MGSFVLFEAYLRSDRVATAKYFAEILVISAIAEYVLKMKRENSFNTLYITELSKQAIQVRSMFQWPSSICCFWTPSILLPEQRETLRLAHLQPIFSFLFCLSLAQRLMALYKTEGEAFRHLTTQLEVLAKEKKRKISAALNFRSNEMHIPVVRKILTLEHIFMELSNKSPKKSHKRPHFVRGARFLSGWLH